MNCSGIKDCVECAARTLCHFCVSDMQCHAYGSLSGCSVGMNCADLKNCVRAVPEFKGYSAPPSGPAATIVCSALVLLCLLSLCMWRIPRKRANGQIRPVIDDSLASRDYLELDTVGSSSMSGPKIGMSRGRKCCYGVISCSVVLVLLGVTLGLLFFPRVPAYALCSRNVDWGGLLKGLATGGKVRADMDMQFSIHNPNRFAVEVQSATANFFWKGISIGTGILGPTTFAPGYIVDFTLNTHFSPTISVASQMLTAHYVGALLIDVDMILETSVSFFDTWSYDFQTNQTAANIDVNAEVSRALCRCP